MIDFENISNLDNETLTNLITALTKEKNKRKAEERTANIYKIKNMLAEIDGLCLDYDINITTNYEYLSGEGILLNDLYVG